MKTTLRSRLGDFLKGLHPNGQRPTHQFCTYFDSGYLPRGLALYRSLERHVPQFTLHIFCLDDVTYDILSRAELEKISLIRLVDLEAFDRDLLAARGRRSQIEYYFTMTSVIPNYLFEAFPEIGTLTYIDADLLFFSNPQPIFAEIGEASVAITPHRFAPGHEALARYGIYNVGWVTWRRDTFALTCLNWYRAKSLEWCYDAVEDSRYGDQKYLDDWPSRFLGVHSIIHKGVNLAPWNNENYQFSLRDGKFCVDDEPLIFYHFHGLKSLYELDPEQTSVKMYLQGPPSFDFDLLMKAVYQPYIEAMCAVREELKAYNLPSLLSNPPIRYTDVPPLAATSPVWRQELDWRRSERSEDWQVEAFWPQDRKRALTIRKRATNKPEFDGGYLGRIARIEQLIGAVMVALNKPLAIVDLCEGDDLIDHAMELAPKVHHCKWIVATSVEILCVLKQHLPDLLGADSLENALAEQPDILLAGTRVARSSDWQSAIRKLIASSRYVIFDMRTFSGTQTSLTQCREIGAKTAHNRWIINERELRLLFASEGLTILREFVLPDPARIADISELADRRLFLIECGSYRDPI